MSSRGWMVALLTFSGFIAGCADHRLRSDANPDSQVACRTNSTADWLYIEQAFDERVLVVVATINGDVAGAHFGPPRRSGELIGDYRERIAREGEEVRVEISLRYSASSAVDAYAIDFEGHFTPPAGGRELHFVGREVRLHNSCG